MRWVWVAWLVSSGCGDNARCLEHEVTIEQGFYGLVIHGSDYADTPSAAAPNEAVTVRDWQNGPVAATAVTDENGMYQLELPVGDYAFCDFSECTTFWVKPRGLLRVDVVHTVGWTFFWALPRGHCED